MILTPYDSLSWAYELHYYLCTKTDLRRKSLISRDTFLNQLVNEICDRHDYHLLESLSEEDQLRTLVSLRPTQSVAKVIQTLKTNVSREFNLEYNLSPPLWARGYLAQSVGHVRLGPVRNYLESQPTHHGFDKRIRPPVFKYRVKVPKVLEAPHCFFNLSHHLVLATRFRRNVFDSELGRDLTRYWLKVADKHDFAIDQISTIPDHIHMIIRIKPRMTIEQCTLLLMNNGQYFVGKHYPGYMSQVKLLRLWQPSAYAGTCGNYTTGLMQHFLSKGA